ncbi:hypothetical protein [Bradyrhizobium sp. JYMT SZCCT0428]|uniref:hypothetical protein n=1 Tax=Bradyrhizobium sp. JYMT SZCCT0428 TaxID=2807673 RepID=UPI001BA8B4AF|nr:hypothetical protein [Bradyrhizobium sp. JYMT SZCCT0428]MBR1153081.1 hypothetical protein [Bradyrhizobium sp. JYMT SZCCT0428]
MIELGQKSIDDLNACELTIDELDAVNGGGRLSDLYHHIVAVIRFHTGTIRNIATTLP